MKSTENHKTTRLAETEEIGHRAILSHPKDNVATANASIDAGTFLLLFSNQKKLRVKESIPTGHKFSLRRIPRGNPVIKYGEKIGKAIRSIEPGEWVHIHNVESLRGKRK